MSDKTIYEANVEMVLRGKIFVQADSSEDAKHRIEKTMSPGDIIPEEYEMTFIEIEGEIDSTNLFKRQIKDFIIDLSKEYHLDPEMLDTVIAEFISKAGKIHKKFGEDDPPECPHHPE